VTHVHPMLDLHPSADLRRLGGGALSVAFLILQGHVNMFSISPSMPFLYCSTSNTTLPPRPAGRPLRTPLSYFRDQRRRCAPRPCGAGPSRFSPLVRAQAHATHRRHLRPAPRRTWVGVRRGYNPRLLLGVGPQGGVTSSTRTRPTPGHIFLLTPGNR
jgi:hypothetical protein